MSGTLNADMITLLNQRASQLKSEKLALHERLDELRSISDEAATIIDIARSWKRANYERQKAVAMILIHQIVISENGDTKVIWNI